MTWWAVAFLLFVWIFVSVFFVYGTWYEYEYFGHVKASKEEIMFYLFLLCVFPAIGFSWMFVFWRRRDLPIIFNRKTGKVTCLIQKWIAVQDWANLKAYVKDLTTVQGGGAPANEGILTLEFPWLDQDGKNIGTLSIPVSGARDAPEALRHRAIYGAAMVWEYIRLYMREGQDALPPFSHMTAKYRISHIRESWKEHNFIKAFREMFEVKVYWWPISIPFHLFVVIPFCFFAIPTDLIYMWLDKVLPRRKWPKELLEACDHVWDGSYN
jgi:hypothetical protein